MEYLLVYVATVCIGISLLDRLGLRLNALKPTESPFVPLLAFLCQMAMLLDLMLHALP